MTVEVIAMGGYQEIGKNMTAVKVDDDVVIFDMGLDLNKLKLHTNQDISRVHSLDLIEKGIIPDDTLMRDVDGKVKAIVCTHGHADHIGAIPKLAHRYDAPIIATKYTLKLIERSINMEKKFKVNNSLQLLNPGEKYQVSPYLMLEFIRSTHSIPQSVIAALHTPEGIVIYANDFKFDNHQKISSPPDYNRFLELGRKGVLTLITESINIDNVNQVKNYSENVAKMILQDTLKNPLASENGLIVATFPSNIERIQAIVDISRNSGRRILLLGRDIDKYCSLAVEMDLLDLPKTANIYGNSNDIDKILAKVEYKRDKYIIITDGHQGEHNALLPRIASGKTPFNIQKHDVVVLSAPVIPNQNSIADRNLMERRLIGCGARIYPNAHVSGHACREDYRDFIKMLNPMHIIPTHGNLRMLAAFAELAEQEGYKMGKDVHVLRNGQAQVFDGGV